MKVAFDATVVHGKKSGVGYYAQELLRSLVDLQTDDDYFVFSHRPLTDEVVRPGRRVRFSTGRFCPIRAIYLHGLLPGLLDGEEPDLVHYTNFLAPVRYRHPYVLTIHDMSLERLKRAHPIAKRLYTKRLIPGAVRGARLILTNSEFSKWETVRFLGVPEERIRVTPLAASTIFHPVESSEKREVLGQYAITRPYFLYVGNLEPRKNLERLLEAFSSIPDEEQLLVLAGNAWFRGDRVVRKVAELGLTDRVRFLGYLPRRHIPALMSAATAFVYPSLLEGFGLPILEAMACGAPVITSTTSALGEIAGEAALGVNPVSVAAMTEALTMVMEDSRLRATLSAKALARAAEFSWETTARTTHDAYGEALECAPRRSVAVRTPSVGVSDERLEQAIRSTLDYGDQFDYPLTRTEVHDRLLGVRVSRADSDRAIEVLGFPVEDGWLTVRPGLGALRKERERRTDEVLSQFQKELKFLASLPFVRMLAFSGATAHRNMADRDVDLFAVVEDGKLWAFVLGVALWAKIRGLRANICLNYVLSDRALPLFETDPFTAQQAASLKPFYGKHVYDRFIEENPFVARHYPNFDPARHRDQYPELSSTRMKNVLEALLRAGPAQVAESVSRALWGGYLKRKRIAVTGLSDNDVLLEKNRIKLHLRSHRRRILDEMGELTDESSPREAVSSAFAPPVTYRRDENAEV